MLLFDCVIICVYSLQKARMQSINCKLAGNSEGVFVFSVQPLTELSTHPTLVLSVILFVFTFLFKKDLIFPPTGKRL